MSKGQVLFGRLGNKDLDIKYFQHLLPTEDIKNVVEPFGGSFAVIRKVYNDTEKYNLFVNDNDDGLIEIYKNPQSYSDLCKKINDIALSNLRDDGNVDFKKLDSIINQNEDIKNHVLLNFWKTDKISMGVRVKPKKVYNDTEHLNLMKKINFSFDDYMKVLEKFKKDKNAFIFIDPPYLYSDNSHYSQQKRKEGQDMTDMVYKLLEFIKDKKTKAKIMIVINSNHLIRWLYKDYIKMEYQKKYGLSRRIESHAVICNY
jgi:site-specific DNA-adenine methylase